MRVVHIARRVGPASGGLGQAVLNLAEAQVAAGHEVTVFGLGDIAGRYRFRYRPLRHRLGRLELAVRLGESLQEEGADVIHSHGLWTHMLWGTDRFCRAYRIPHVVAPHGMLDPWALRQGGLRKAMVRRAFQDSILRQAAALHALTVEEEDILSIIAPEVPVEVIPNGVPDDFFRVTPDPAGRAVIYAGRLHPKKGLIALVEAWAGLGADRGGWRLVIAGPDEGGYAVAVQEAIVRCGVGESVRMAGPLTREDLLGLYSSGGIAVLPSHSEGLSVAVLEALGAGIPAVVTRACHMPFISRIECGLECEGPSDLGRALQVVMGRDDEARAVMGARGREYVRRHHSWEHIEERVGALYAGACGHEQGAPADAPL